ncbi:MAG: DivIVA domain-containing protein [Cyclobacteriaceae bacterium]
MKITPLEIRQKAFEKKLRGYDKDEVNAFLVSLSNEWERIQDDNKELRIKLAQAEKEVQKLREVESSLFKTLKTAEDTGANLVDQANKAAELHLKETQMNADAMMSEAKSKAKNIIEKAEMEARNLIEEMQDAVKDLQQNYKALENHRDNITGELRNLADDIHERIKRSANQQPAFKMEDHTKKVKAMMRESEDWINKEKLEVKPVKMTPLTQEGLAAGDKPKPRKSEEQKNVARSEKKVSAPKEQATSEPKGSFFDEID